MNAEAIAQLTASVRGPIIQPGHAEYDTARAVYNAMHDRRPALIIQAADIGDVVAGVNYAREQGLLLAIRGGGHSVPGYGSCDGGLVIDLGGMNGVFVDTTENVVIAQGGCTLGDLDHATHAYGLAVPGGTVSSTGLAGLTLGGGMGHLSRSCGLSCDNLVSAEVVTAAGEIVTCNATSHPELFWAIRGGGGNFGVVTTFKFRAHSVPTVFAGPTFFHMDAQVARNYEAWVSQAPDQLNALFAMALAPPAPFVPEEYQLTPVMVILPCWSGDEAEDEKIQNTVSECGEIIGQAMWRMPYPEVNMFFDELLPAGLRHYWKANASMGFTGESIAVHMEHGAKVPNVESGMFLFTTNAACHRVPDDETAYASRSAKLSAVISGTWHDAADDAANSAWVRNYFEALKPHSEPGGYVNFMSGDDQDIIDDNYGPKLQRLKAIKAQYDPDNLFRMNQNIAP